MNNNIDNIDLANLDVSHLQPSVNLINNNTNHSNISKLIVLIEKMTNVFLMINNIQSIIGKVKTFIDKQLFNIKNGVELSKHHEMLDKYWNGFKRKMKTNKNLQQLFKDLQGEDFCNKERLFKNIIVKTLNQIKRLYLYLAKINMLADSVITDVDGFLYLNFLELKNGKYSEYKRNILKKYNQFMLTKRQHLFTNFLNLDEKLVKFKLTQYQDKQDQKNNKLKQGSMEDKIISKHYSNLFDSFRKIKEYIDNDGEQILALKKILSMSYTQFLLFTLYINEQESIYGIYLWLVKIFKFGNRYMGSKSYSDASKLDGNTTISNNASIDDKSMSFSSPKNQMSEQDMEMLVELTTSISKHYNIVFIVNLLTSNYYNVLKMIKWCYEILFILKAHKYEMKIKPIDILKRKGSNIPGIILNSERLAIQNMKTSEIVLLSSYKSSKSESDVPPIGTQISYCTLSLPLGNYHHTFEDSKYLNISCDFEEMYNKRKPDSQQILESNSVKFIKSCEKIALKDPEFCTSFEKTTMFEFVLQQINNGNIIKLLIPLNTSITSLVLYINVLKTLARYCLRELIFLRNEGDPDNSLALLVQYINEGKWVIICDLFETPSTNKTLQKYYIHNMISIINDIALCSNNTGCFSFNTGSTGNRIQIKIKGVNTSLNLNTGGAVFCEIPSLMIRNNVTIDVLNHNFIQGVPISLYKFGDEFIDKYYFSNSENTVENNEYRNLLLSNQVLSFALLKFKQKSINKKFPSKLFDLIMYGENSKEVPSNFSNSSNVQQQETQQSVSTNSSESKSADKRSLFIKIGKQKDQMSTIADETPSEEHSSLLKSNSLEMSLSFDDLSAGRIHKFRKFNLKDLIDSSNFEDFVSHFYFIKNPNNIISQGANILSNIAQLSNNMLSDANNINKQSIMSLYARPKQRPKKFYHFYNKLRARDFFLIHNIKEYKRIIGKPIKENKGSKKYNMNGLVLFDDTIRTLSNPKVSNKEIDPSFFEYNKLSYYGIKILNSMLKYYQTIFNIGLLHIVFLNNTDLYQRNLHLDQSNSEFSLNAKLNFGKSSPVSTPLISDYCVYDEIDYILLIYAAYLHCRLVYVNNYCDLIKISDCKKNNFFDDFHDVEDGTQGLIIVLDMRIISMEFYNDIYPNLQSDTKTVVIDGEKYNIYCSLVVVLGTNRGNETFYKTSLPLKDLTCRGNTSEDKISMQYDIPVNMFPVLKVSKPLFLITENNVDIERFFNVIPDPPVSNALQATKANIVFFIKWLNKSLFNGISYYISQELKYYRESKRLFGVRRLPTDKRSISFTCYEDPTGFTHFNGFNLIDTTRLIKIFISNVILFAKIFKLCTLTIRDHNMTYNNKYDKNTVLLTCCSARLWVVCILDAIKTMLSDIKHEISDNVIKFISEFEKFEESPGKKHLNSKRMINFSSNELDYEFEEESGSSGEEMSMKTIRENISIDHEQKLETDRNQKGTREKRNGKINKNKIAGGEDRSIYSLSDEDQYNNSTEEFFPKISKLKIDKLKNDKRKQDTCSTRMSSKNQGTFRNTVKNNEQRLHNFLEFFDCNYPEIKRARNPTKLIVIERVKDAELFIRNALHVSRIDINKVQSVPTSATDRMKLGMVGLHSQITRSKIEMDTVNTFNSINASLTEQVDRSNIVDQFLYKQFANPNKVDVIFKRKHLQFFDQLDYDIGQFEGSDTQRLQCFGYSVNLFANHFTFMYSAIRIASCIIAGVTKSVYVACVERTPNLAQLLSHTGVFSLVNQLLSESITQIMVPYTSKNFIASKKSKKDRIKTNLFKNSNNSSLIQKHEEDIIKNKKENTNENTKDDTNNDDSNINKNLVEKEVLELPNSSENNLQKIVYGTTNAENIYNPNFNFNEFMILRTIFQRYSALAVNQSTGTFDSISSEKTENVILYPIQNKFLHIILKAPYTIGDGNFQLCENNDYKSLSYNCIYSRFLDNITNPILTNNKVIPIKNINTTYINVMTPNSVPLVLPLLSPNLVINIVNSLLHSLPKIQAITNNYNTTIDREKVISDMKVNFVSPQLISKNVIKSSIVHYPELDSTDIMNIADYMIIKLFGKSTTRSETDFLSTLNTILKDINTGVFIDSMREIHKMLKERNEELESKHSSNSAYKNIRPSELISVGEIAHILYYKYTKERTVMNSITDQMTYEMRNLYMQHGENIFTEFFLNNIVRYNSKLDSNVSIDTFKMLVLNNIQISRNIKHNHPIAAVTNDGHDLSQNSPSIKSANLNNNGNHNNESNKQEQEQITLYNMIDKRLFIRRPMIRFVDVVLPNLVSVIGFASQYGVEMLVDPGLTKESLFSVFPTRIRDPDRVYMPRELGKFFGFGTEELPQYSSDWGIIDMLRIAVYKCCGIMPSRMIDNKDRYVKTATTTSHTHSKFEQETTKDKIKDSSKIIVIISQDSLTPIVRHILNQIAAGCLENVLLPYDERGLIKAYCQHYSIYNINPSFNVLYNRIFRNLFIYILGRNKKLSYHNSDVRKLLDDPREGLLLDLTMGQDLTNTYLDDYGLFYSSVPRVKDFPLYSNSIMTLQDMEIFVSNLLMKNRIVVAGMTTTSVLTNIINNLNLEYIPEEHTLRKRKYVNKNTFYGKGLKMVFSIYSQIYISILQRIELYTKMILIHLNLVLNNISYIAKNNQNRQQDNVSNKVGNGDNKSPGSIDNDTKNTKNVSLENSSVIKRSPLKRLQNIQQNKPSSVINNNDFLGLIRFISSIASFIEETYKTREKLSSSIAFVITALVKIQVTQSDYVVNEEMIPPMNLGRAFDTIKILNKKRRISRTGSDFLSPFNKIAKLFVIFDVIKTFNGMKDKLINFTISQKSSPGNSDNIIQSQSQRVEKSDNLGSLVSSNFNQNDKDNNSNEQLQPDKQPMYSFDELSDIYYQQDHDNCVPSIIHSAFSNAATKNVNFVSLTNNLIIGLLLELGFIVVTNETPSMRLRYVNPSEIPSYIQRISECVKQPDRLQHIISPRTILCILIDCSLCYSNSDFSLIRQFFKIKLFFKNINIIVVLQNNKNRLFNFRLISDKMEFKDIREMFIEVESVSTISGEKLLNTSVLSNLYFNTTSDIKRHLNKRIGADEPNYVNLISKAKAKYENIIKILLYANELNNITEIVSHESDNISPEDTALYMIASKIQKQVTQPNNLQSPPSTRKIQMDKNAPNNGTDKSGTLNTPRDSQEVVGGSNDPGNVSKNSGVVFNDNNTSIESVDSSYGLPVSRMSSILRKKRKNRRSGTIQTESGTRINSSDQKDSEYKDTKKRTVR